MANSMVLGGKAAYKRGCSGAGVGRRMGMGRRARRGSGSDDASDEEYFVGGDDGEGESSYGSYSSDASLETEDTEEEEEEAYDTTEDEEMEVARGGRRPRRGMASAGEKRGTLPPRRGTYSVPVVSDEEEEEVERPPVRRSRTQRHVSPVVAEEEEGEFDDEDFALEEEDDDEEEAARAPVRKTGGVKSKPVKKPKRKRGSMNSNVKGKKETAPLTRKKRRWIVQSSDDDDDDFVVKDKISVAASSRKRKKEKKRRSVPFGRRKRKRSRVLPSNASDSDSSDFDCTISVDVPRRLDRLVRKPLSPGDLGEKGKGKDVDGLGKQVCGVCLSEERKRGIRGVLDCCTHYFCFTCIMEWSKVESRCPLCKRRFETVSKAARSDEGFSFRAPAIRIPKRDQVYQPSDEDIRSYLDPYATVVCAECQLGGDDNLMLLCDICDSPAHTYCVGLGREVPDGNWFCDVCRLMDPGSSNSQVLQSVVEHEVRNDLFQGNSQGVVDSVTTLLCSPPETPRQTAMPRQLPSEGIDQGVSNRHPPSLGYHETFLEMSGFTASTLSGRRSIHLHMRNMLSDNIIRWRSEYVAGNNMIQPSSTGSDVFSEQRHEAFGVQQQSLTNEIYGRSSRLFLSSRVNSSPFTHDEESHFHMAEASNEFTEW